MARLPTLDIINILRQGKPLLVSVLSAVVFGVFGGHWFDDLSHFVIATVLFIWLFAVIMWSAFAIVRHADCLAIRLGEPYGTLIFDYKTRVRDGFSSFLEYNDRAGKNRL
jgi:Ca2+:H+ antiporter